MCGITPPELLLPPPRPVPATQEEDGVWKGDIGKAFWLVPVWGPEGTNNLRDANAVDPVWYRDAPNPPPKPRVRDVIDVRVKHRNPQYAGTTLHRLLTDELGYVPENLDYFYDEVKRSHIATWEHNGQRRKMFITDQQANEMADRYYLLTAHS